MLDGESEKVACASADAAQGGASEPLESPPSPARVRAEASDTSHKCLQSAALVYEVTLRKDAYGLGIYFTESPGGRAIVDPKLPFYRLPDGAIAPGEASSVIMPGDVLHAISGHELAQQASFGSVVEELRCIPLGDVTLAFERPLPRVTLVLTPEQASSQTTSNQAEHEEQEPQNAELEVNNQLDVENDGAEENKKPSVKRWSVLQRLSSITSTGAATEPSPSREAVEIAALEELLSQLEAKLQSADESLERERKCRFLAERKNILYRNELLRVSEENALLKFRLARETSAGAQKDAFCRSQLHLAI